MYNMMPGDNRLAEPPDPNDWTDEDDIEPDYWEDEDICNMCGFRGARASGFCADCEDSLFL